uniref:Cyclin-G-associated kinase n=1 Tax=Steinernema glaseri TaxID=37863 RepID=A0A1I7YGM0_9BILA
MTDLFRSAFNYISQAAPNRPPGAGGAGDHALVGQNIEVGGFRLKIRSLLAEGGFALVFSAQDAQGSWFALKRQIAADREAADAVLKEIRILRELTGHPAILRYVQAAQLNTQDSLRGRTEFLLLTELCSGGSVVDFLNKNTLSPEQIVKIFSAACSAVRHMHDRPAPITHRDIKIENLLFDSSGHVKLCDFGSATTEVHFVDDSWSALRRSQVEEEMQRHTTPMYRAPEILDLYQNFPIGPSQDIWALGCILYYLCYRTHPFEDSAKLRIINANYNLPPEATSAYSMFHPLIQRTLQPDPRKRPRIGELCDSVGALAVAMGVDLKTKVPGVDLSALTGGAIPEGSPQTRHAPPRPPPPAPPRNESLSQEPPSAAQVQASAVFGALKGQGMSLFKNIRDRSAAVVQTVQSTYGGKGPDVMFVTSRLAIAPMSEGMPEALAGPAEDVTRQYLMEQCGERKFAIYNLGQRRLRGDYGGFLSESPLPQLSSGLSPTLNQIMSLARNVAVFWRQNKSNIAVITGPEQYCVLMAAALLIYSRIATRSISAVDFITRRRPHPVCLPASFHRQLDVLSTVAHSTRAELNLIVHNKPVLLDSIEISPTPLFNRLKTGCRPYVEVYSAGTKLWNTSKEYEQIRAFEAPECKSVKMQLGAVPVGDDVTVLVYHTRWSRVANRVQLVQMFTASFHANFVDPSATTIEFGRSDLDRNLDDDPKMPDPFRYRPLEQPRAQKGTASKESWLQRVVLGIRVGANDRGFTNGVAEPPAFLGYDTDSIVPRTLTQDEEEHEYVCRQLGDVDFGRGATASPPSPSHQPQDNFFAELDWNHQAHTQHIPAPSERAQPVPNLWDEPSLVTPAPVRNGVEDAEFHERLAGIRIGTEEEDDDADMYKFDYEKKPKPAATQPQKNQIDDLLDFGSPVASTAPAPSNAFDPFAHFESAPATANLATDLLGFGAHHGMSRNVSAPSFEAPKAANFDPFAEFLASNSNSAAGSSTRLNDISSAGNSGRATPTTRPNYSRSNFETSGSTTTGMKPKVTANAFDDLLASQGFSSSSKNSNRSLADMRKEEENKQMDPVAVAIRDWKAGKEKNIRALLCSLNDILWEGADKWNQPNMSDILSAGQVKKNFHKALLVVHPDKQVGNDNYELAKEIAGVLKTAWDEFVNAGSPSL